MSSTGSSGSISNTNILGVSAVAGAAVLPFTNGSLLDTLFQGVVAALALGLLLILANTIILKIRNRK